MTLNHDVNNKQGTTSAYALGSRLAIFVLVVGLLNSTIGRSQTPKEVEYKLKAVYLFNFLQFTEWPDSAFEDSRAPIIVGVLGDDPFGSVLDETIRSEKAGGHPIVVRRFRTMDKLTKCQVLFVGLSELENARDVLQRVGKSPTLIVSDIDGFSDLGGSISFYLEKNKIRFEINMQALRRADLKVSSKLLRLARIVNPF